MFHTTRRRRFTLQILAGAAITLSAQAVAQEVPALGSPFLDDAADLDDTADVFSDLPQIPDTRVVAPRRAAANDAALAPGSAAVIAPAQSMPLQNTSSAASRQSGLLAADEVLSDQLSPSLGSQSGSSMTVISGAAIRNSGQTELSEVLRQVPGLDVVRSGGLGQQVSVFMRGSNSSQTKVLIDGIPANDPAAPSRAFDFSLINLEQVQRIEVLRGPQSTLYGSDAIGGVINIITETREGPPRFRLSQMGGAFETSRTAASVSGGSDLIQYSLGGSYQDVEGFSSAGRPPGNIEDDYYRNGSLNGRLRLQLTENLRADFIGRYSDISNGLDTAFDPTFTFPQDDLSTLDQENTFARTGLTYSALDGLWTHRVGHSYTQYDRFSFSPFGGPVYGRANRYNWTNDMNLLRSTDLDLTATSGVDYLEEEIYSATAGGRVSQHDVGGFVTMASRIGSRLFLTAGARWDDYSSAGEAFTYRTTGRYQIGESEYQLHGAIGTGFRAPALAELFGLVGNPSLQSEYSKGWEAGLTRDFRDGRGTLDVTYFRNDFEDLVVFAPNGIPPFFGQLENVGTALASGVELSSLFNVGATSLFVNYTYTHTEDKSTGLRLLRRPRNKWSFGASRSLWDGRGNLSWNANYVGNRLDISNNITDAYWLVNASGSFNLNDHWRVFGRVDNVLDQDYEEALGFGTSPIAAYAGAELTF